MKSKLTLCLIVACSLGAGSVMAKDEYSAPKLKLSAAPHVDPVVKEAQWEKGYEFKVQERPDSDRAVASDKDQPVREPSSKLEPRRGVLSDESPRPWMFSK